jgi:hypothetical protein
MKKLIIGLAAVVVVGTAAGAAIAKFNPEILSDILPHKTSVTVPTIISGEKAFYSDVYIKEEEDGNRLAMSIPSEMAGCIATKKTDFDGDGQDEMLYLYFSQEDDGRYGLRAVMAEKNGDVYEPVAETVIDDTVLTSEPTPFLGDVNLFMTDVNGRVALTEELYATALLADGCSWSVKAYVYNGSEFENITYVCDAGSSFTDEEAAEKIAELNNSGFDVAAENTRLYSYGAADYLVNQMEAEEICNINISCSSGNENANAEFSEYLNGEREAVNPMVFTFAVPDDNISVSLNGQVLDFTDDQTPVMDEEHDRVLVPIRKIVESLGATVEWDGDNGIMVVHRGNNTVQFYMNSPQIKVNGRKKRLDAVPVVVNGRMLVPVRAISEAFGSEVSWNGEQQTVYISDDAEYATAQSVSEYASDGAGYQQAYADFLNGFDGSQFKFQLAYIDGDDVPEVIITPIETSSTLGLDMYTYAAGEVKKIEYPYLLGAYSTIRYKAGENIVDSSNGGQDGVFYDSILSIDNGSLVESKNLSWDTNTNEYLINDEAVSAEEYEQITNEILSDYAVASTETAMDINAENINSALGL